MTTRPLLVRGMRDERVGALQKELKNRGRYDGRVDDYYGPVTERGVMMLQQDQGLPTTGQGTTDTQNTLGLPTATGMFALPDYTSGDKDTRFNGLPGKPEIWLDKDTGIAYVVYDIPGTEPPVPLLFEVPSKADLESFFGDKDIKYDREFTTEEIDATGAIPFGTSDNIDPNLPGNPWAGFLDRMERAMEVQPWLEDDEVWALYAGAWLEGRDVEEWELQTTDWWQGLNEAERNWIALQGGDPSEADRILEDNYLAVFSQFQALGVAEPNAELVEFMAQRWTYGNWSQVYLQEQILSLTGLASGGIKLDKDLKKFLKEKEIAPDKGELGTNRVLAEFRKWLGPRHPPSEKQLQKWADRFRRSPEAAADELTNYLRQQRLALYKHNDDPAITYEDMAAPWRSFMTNAWGQQIDETSSTFMKLMRLNDAEEGGKLLRREGLKQGVSSVVDDAVNKLREATTGQVVNPL